MEEPEDTESNGSESEVKQLVTRAEGAAVLRRLADGIANGSEELGDEEVVVAVPERFELEIEHEQEYEKVEFEAELEWPVVDDEAVAAEADEPAAEVDADKPINEVIGVGDSGSNAQFELYRDSADEWRWRLVHANGNIIADSGEGYGRKTTARNGLESVMHNAPSADIVAKDK